MAYIAYKGFNKNLECTFGSNIVKYDVGETFTSDYYNDIKSMKYHLNVGTKYGYHYCDMLVDTFKFYPRNGSNRFCEIEVLGDYNRRSDKCISTQIKILRELTDSDIDELILEQHFRFDILQEIQTALPLSHIGGSTALFLHGVRIPRHNINTSNDSKSDFDIVLPYYIDPKSIETLNIEFSSEKSSGNDFDYTFGISSKLSSQQIKIDVKIDPKQRYEIIEYKGFKFKVSSILTILEAKMRYALAGNSKHRDDIISMICKNSKKININYNESDIFG